MGIRMWVAALAGMLLAACNQAQPRTFTAVEGDAFLGPANAQVVLVEYGAPTCPACLMWHDRYWKDLKAAYIDTGKIKFVFRPLPSHNPPVDAAIAAIARCVGNEQFMSVIDEGFVRHAKFEQATASGTVQAELVALGKTFGMNAEQTEACVRDPAGRQRIFDIQAQAEADRVQGTPTFLLNGREVRDPSFQGLSQAIDAALASTMPAPAAAPTPEAAPPAAPAAAPPPAQ
jgi:protein-disulfide isomerase